MKIMNVSKKFYQRGAAAATGLVAGSAFADPTDFTALTSSIDLSSVGTAILAIAAIMATVYVTWKGARMVIAALRGL